MADTAILTVRIFDGRRLLMTNPSNIRVRLYDGNQILMWEGTIDHADQQFDVPFYDSARDWYRVIVSRPGWTTSAMYPVKLSRSGPSVVDLMLLPEQNRVNTTGARWADLQVSHRRYCDLLSAITADAQARWDTLLADVNALIPIDFLNLLTAMRDIRLPSGKAPIDYLRAVDWDKSPQQDRFWVWVDHDIIGDVVEGAREGYFDREPNPGALHPEATLSYKENALGEANVQFTFLENNVCTSPGFDKCTLMEPDIDYYDNLIAHGLLEVLPGFFSKTDPRMVYMLRWMSSRRIPGMHEFDPPYTIEGV
jgi:hypothetical protein